MNKVRRSALLLVLVYFAALCVRLAFTARLGHDDIEHLHTAWLMLQGGRPFLDFFQKQSPLLWWLLMPLVALADGDLATAVFLGRALMLLGYLGTVVATWRLADLAATQSNVARVSVLLLLSAPVVSYNLLVIRPDGLMIALLLWGLVWLQRGTASRRPFALVVAGGLLALAGAVLLKAVPVAAAAWLATVYAIRRSDGSFGPAVRITAWLALGALCVAGAFIAALAAQGLLEGFYFFNVTFNGQLYRQPWAGDVPWGTRVSTVLLNELRQEPWLLVLSLASLWFLPRWWRHPRRSSERNSLVTQAALLLVGVALLLVNRLPFYSYFLLPLLAGAVMGPLLLKEIQSRLENHWLVYRKGRQERAIRVHRVLGFLLVATLVVAGTHWHNRFSTSEGQLDKLRALPRSQAVHVMPNHPVFAPDANRIWDNVERYRHTLRQLDVEGRLPAWAAEAYQGEY